MLESNVLRNPESGDHVDSVNILETNNSVKQNKMQKSILEALEILPIKPGEVERSETLTKLF
jgi:hypothetical protein